MTFKNIIHEEGTLQQYNLLCSVVSYNYTNVTA